MTVKQLAEIFKAKDRARMLRGEEQPRQEALYLWEWRVSAQGQDSLRPNPPVDVDWEQAKFASTGSR
jgi:hypothetical protein